LDYKQKILFAKKKNTFFHVHEERDDVKNYIIENTMKSGSRRKNDAVNALVL
jgi:hypothetical protein